MKNFGMCFHAEALSNNPTSDVAHSLHDTTDVTIRIVSHLSQVLYTPSHRLEGESRFATK